MKKFRFSRRNTGNVVGAFLSVKIMMLVVMALYGAVNGVALGQSTTPNLQIGEKEYPDADAIILRWEQSWTLERNGTRTRRDHKWIKLINRRPIRQLADPRIDFVAGRDKLVVHKAQAILRSGETLPVPEYSYNVAANGTLAGWPEYASWQQQVISFSGVEPGVVLELDYEVKSPADSSPWLEADMRLSDDYPTVDRVINVTLPSNVKLLHQVDGLPESGGKLAKEDRDGSTQYRWSFKDLAGDRSESNSVSWQKRSPRIRFTTCGSAAEWAWSLASCANMAVELTPAVRGFAERIVEGVDGDAERARALAKELRESFSFVNSPDLIGTLRCRSAERTHLANYGHQLESASLLAAMGRAVGFEAFVKIGVDADRWDERVPTTSAFDGAIVEFSLDDGPFLLHPQLGEVRNPGSWGRRWLLSVGPDKELQKTYILDRGERKPSELHATGKLMWHSDGALTGELQLRLTGRFFDPLDLDSGKAQQTLTEEFVQRILSDFNVSSQSVLSLSDDEYRVSAHVALKDVPKKHGDYRILRFGEGPAFLSDVPLPLDRSYRRTAVAIGGRIRENIRLTIEFDKSLAIDAVPASLSMEKGDWGRAIQNVIVEDQTITFRRDISIEQDSLSPKDFAAFRQTINQLRSDSSLTLAVHTNNHD